MQDFPPDTPGPVLILPLILTLLGSIMYFIARAAEVRLERVTYWRWVAAIPLFIGLWVAWKWYGKILGYEYPWQIFGGPDAVARDLYLNGLLGRRNMLAHQVVFYIPFTMLVAAVAFFIYDRVTVKRRKTLPPTSRPVV